MSLERLAKVLALADSPHEGESLAALRNARILMQQESLCFADLGSALSALQAGVRLDGGSSGKTASGLKAVIDSLTGELQISRDQLADASRDAEYLRQQIGSLNRSLVRTRAESERWRLLAREMADQLWELGQAADPERKTDSEATEFAPKRQQA